MPLPWFFIDSMTAPEPLLRGVSSAAEKSILFVNTSLESLRRVCVKFREASAKVRESDTMPESSSSNGEVDVLGDAVVFDVAAEAAAVANGMALSAIGVLAAMDDGTTVAVVEPAEIFNESSLDVKPLSLGVARAGVKVLLGTVLLGVCVAEACTAVG